jgi:RHS repeat-associated protein
MSKDSVARFFLLCGVVLALGSVARAQVVTGTPPFGSFGGGPDIINLANLNSHITIPIINKAGRGTPFTYNLTYDSSVWYPVTTSGVTTWTPVLNWGWSVQTAPITGDVTATTTIVTCTTTLSNWVFHDGYGGSHSFSGTAVLTSGSCGTSSTPINALASDGSGYTILAYVTGPATITSRAGQIMNLPVNSSTGAGSFTDANGNQISINSGGVFTDTLGQTALTVAGGISNDPWSPTSPLTFTYVPPAGGTASYTINSMYYTVETNFGVSGIGEFGRTRLSLPNNIVLPDGTQYTFTYEATPGTCVPEQGGYEANCVTGRIASVTLPTGGTISYTYSGGNNGILSDGSTAKLGRTTPDGSWTYAHSESGTAWTTTITDPQSNQTTMNFQGIYETERQVYYQGAPLETIYTCYNGNTTTSTCDSTTVAVPISQRTVFPQWPGGQQSRNDTFYNTYGLVTEYDEYAYGSGAPGSMVRKTLTSYASLTNGIVDKPASVTVENGSGHIVVAAKTTYCYDEGTPSGTSTCAAAGSPTPTSGTPQHVAVTGSRGNLTTIASLANASTTLGQTFTYYDTGNVITATDINTAQSTYHYAGSSCGNSFPTSVTEPLSLSQSMVWNCIGGVETSATDENSQITSAAYTTDPDFWRPNSTTDQESNVTAIAYAVTATGIMSVESSLPFNGSVSTSDALVTLDSSGRAHIAQVKESPSSPTYDSVEADYNAVGLVSRSTLPYAASGGTTNSTAPGVTWTYDTLGRTLTATDSGTGTTTYSYNQNDVLITSGPAPPGEIAKSRQYEYDSLGRVTSVCEITAGTSGWPGGSCGQTVAATGYLTTYTYDLNNNLIGVRQNAQSATTQTRTYSYDNLSRVISEINVESGTTSYVYDSNSTCATTSADVGSLVKKTDAVGNVICYLHDGLQRVTSITYPSGSYAANTPNKYFVYDAATVNGVAMTYVKARMAEAYTATSPTGTKITDLGFSYTVRGEISAVSESTPHSGGYYNMNAAYWPNGAFKQIGGLPQVGGVSTMPTLTYTPDGEGRPAVVTASAGQNPVSGTIYNTASLLTSMTLGSNDSDSFTFDPNTNRMTQYQFNVNGQSVTGMIHWNALGTPSTLDITDAFNSADTQNCSYTHDDLTRLATVNCGTIWGQNFAYDAFGNITKTVLSGSSGTSFQPTYAVPSTNRIASLPSFTPTYDANGNLTQDPQHQYGWDSEGRPVTIDTVNLTYDALDRMVEQNNAGTYTQIVYDPLGEKFGLMSGQTLKKAFAPLPDGGIAAYTSSGLAYYRHPDWLGSSRLASTLTRGIYSDTAYAPFGEPYAQSGTTDISFTGQNQDTASNLYDFLFREDSSTQGRWVSPDPVGLAAATPTDPQSWNRYTYVRNSPLTLVDSLGLCPPNTICVTTNQGCVINLQGCDGNGNGNDNGSNNPLTVGGQGGKTHLPLQSGIGNAGGCSPPKGTTSIVSANATTNAPTIAAGSALGEALGGPPGAALGGIIGSFFGVGGTTSYVPSTHSLYMGPTLVFAPALNGGSGFGGNAVSVPSSQNPNSIANGLSYSLSFQPLPFLGSTVVKSPGSGPPVVGPSVGTRIPLSFGVSYNFRVKKGGC